MKQKILAGKTATRTNLISQSESSAGQNAVSIAPPDYGIDIIDNSQAEGVPHQKSPEPLIRAKLTIGQPNDKYEQEADRVADEVMRISGADIAHRMQDDEEEKETIQTRPLGDRITPLIQRQDEYTEEEEEVTVQASRSNNNGVVLQRLCPECEEETVQRQTKEEDEEGIFQAKTKNAETPSVTSGIESRIRNIRGGGQSLDRATRFFFEPRFGVDFESVRVHTDAAAENITNRINAKAFTFGQDVVFGAGQYVPDGNEGKRLIAHELTHVLQQSGTSRNADTISLKRDPANPQKENAGLYLGLETIGVSTENGCYGEVDFHLVEAIKDTWLSAATRYFGWGAHFSEEDGYGAYIKGIVFRFEEPPTTIIDPTKAPSAIEDFNPDIIRPGECFLIAPVTILNLFDPITAPPCKSKSENETDLCPYKPGLDPTLKARVNQMLTALKNKNIKFTCSDDVRPAKTAHIISTAYHIYQRGGITLDDLRTLPDGKDIDGNVWYKKAWEKDSDDEEVWEKARDNAFEIAKKQGSGYVNERLIRSNTINCAYEGYDNNDPHRLPNETDVPVSSHVRGAAVDVRGVEWNEFGGPWSPKAKRFIGSFGLYRPYNDKSKTYCIEEPWHFELSPEPIIENREDNENDKKTIQRKEVSPEQSPVVSPQLLFRIDGQKGKGRALDPNVQRKMGNVMDSDFSGVRIHTDEEANLFNEQLNARAFTSGRDIYFRQGEYQPQSHDGRKLIAHELSHVVQQAAGFRRNKNLGKLDNNCSSTIQTKMKDLIHINGLSDTKRENDLQNSIKLVKPHSSSELNGDTVLSRKEDKLGVRSEKDKETVEEEKTETKATETEPSEKKRRPVEWTEYIVNNKKAYVRDSEFNIYYIDRINNNAAYLRNPENNYEPYTFSNPAETVEQEGTKLKKIRRNDYRLVIPKSTPVKKIEEVSKEGVKYFKVEWGETRTTGWIKGGNTTSFKDKIPEGIKVIIKSPKKAKGTKSEYVLVTWDEGNREGWTDYRNLTPIEWNLTFATAFRAQSKMGLETSESKRTRLRFEDDGILLRGKVVKEKANKRDPVHFRVLPDELELGEPCLVLERRGSFYRVIDFAGAWGATNSPPGWWTKRYNIKTERGRVDVSEISNKAVRDYVKENQAEESAADITTSAWAFKMTGQLIAHISANNATKRLPTGEAVKIGNNYDNLVPGVYLVLDQKRAPSNNIIIVKVTKLDDDGASEYWVRNKYVKFKRKKASEHSYSIEKKDSDLFLIMRRKPAVGKEEAAVTDEYKISLTVARKLEEAFSQKVKKTIDIEGKPYSENQKKLLEYAKNFALSDSPKLPESFDTPLTPVDNIELDIPIEQQISAKQYKNENVRLSTDLMNRMRRFYQFLRHTRLISGPPTGLWGIRSRSRAHELSTKWTLSTRSGHLKSFGQRLEFARRLVSLGGKPDVAGIQWLLPYQIRILDEAIRIIDDPETYRESWLFPLLQAFSAKDLVVTSVFLYETIESIPARELRQSYDIRDVRLLIDEFIKECRRNVYHIGNHRPQNAPANEGYPTWEKDNRRPNTNDKTGVSNHVGGEAIDVTFPFYFNYYDLIIDAVALCFGLCRPVKDSPSPEHWHYERVGISRGERAGGEAEESPMKSGEQ